MTETLLALGLVAVLIPSLVIHEFAHAWTADMLGDPTPRNAGRISFNPVRHVDPFGTLVLPIVMALVAPFVIGYARPVMIMPGNLRNPRLHSVVVALAGPASNFALAGLGIIAFRLLRPADDTFFWFAFALVIVVNVVLGIFNMLPIPPLDGSALIDAMLPNRYLGVWYRIRPFTIVLVFAMVIFFRGSLEPILLWAVDLWEAQQ